MALQSAILARSPQLVAAQRNQPSLGFASRGEGVAVLQTVLHDLGYPLPKSIRPDDRGDGEFGNETMAAVRALQMDFQLPSDGVAGKLTLERLDALLRSGWFSRSLLAAAEMAGCTAAALAPTNSLALASFDSGGSGTQPVLVLRHLDAALARVLGRHGMRPTPPRNSPPLLPPEPAIGMAPNPEGLVQVLAAMGLVLIGAMGIVLTAPKDVAVPKLPTTWSVPQQPTPPLLELGMGALIALAKTYTESVKALIPEVMATLERLRQCLQNAKNDECRLAVQKALEIGTLLYTRTTRLLEFLMSPASVNRGPHILRLIEQKAAELRALLGQLLKVLGQLRNGPCCPGVRLGG